MKFVTKTKLLGVKLDNLLSWSYQIDDIVTKMGKGITNARKCIAYVPSNSMADDVRSIVLSHLEYCPVVWSSAARKHRLKLQVAQNRAARLTLNCSFRTNVMEMHRELSCLTVEANCEYHILRFMHNVIWKKTPHFFCECLLLAGFCHTYTTRHWSISYIGLIVFCSFLFTFVILLLLY